MHCESAAAAARCCRRRGHRSRRAPQVVLDLPHLRLTLGETRALLLDHLWRRLLGEAAALEQLARSTDLMAAEPWLSRLTDALESTRATTAGRR
jgi:hypothetical protein